MKRLYIFTILLSVFALTGNAQQNDYGWRIGLYSGGMGYFGDLNTRIINPQTQFLANPTQNFRPAFGLSIERNVNAQFGIKALWSNGRFTANDRTVNFQNVLQTDAFNFTRSLNARTQINDFNLIGSLYLERSRTFKKIQFSPYLMLGVGLTDFEVFGDLFYGAGQQYHYWSDFTVRNNAENDPFPEEETVIVLQDGIYETDLTSLQTEDQAYSTLVPNIPFGLGFKFRFGKQLNLNLETLFHYTFTDYLDDVSGVYPTFETFEPLQSYASNPTGQQGIWRGREDDRFNDIYTFNTISLQYNFGYKAGSTRPPVEFSNVGQGEKTVYEREIIMVNESGDTLRIEKQIREDNAEETARIRELSEAQSILEEEIAMLEKEIGEEEMPEAEVVVEVDPERPSRKDRRRDRLEREAEEAARIEKLNEEKATIEEEIAMLEKEIGEEEMSSEIPEVEIVVEEPAVEVVETDMPKMETETSMTPEVEIVTEPDITMTEGERPARPPKPDIGLGGETMPEIEIVTEPEISEGAEIEVEMPEIETEEVEEPLTRRERRRNRRNKEIDVTIGEPDEPSVEIVVGNEEPEMSAEITIEQPEAPEIEIDVETPTEPMVEVEVEEPTEPMVEVEIEEPTEPMVEVEVEEPTEPMVEVEVKEPTEPMVEVEVEEPTEPMVEVEVEEPTEPMVEVEEPTEPMVEVEVEEPTEPMVEVEVEEPTEPMVEVEVEEPTEPMVEVEVEEPTEPMVEVEVEEPTKPAIEVETEMPDVAVKTDTPKDDRSTVLNPNIENPTGVNFTSTRDAIDTYKGFSILFEDEAYYVAVELYDKLDGLVQTMHRFPSLSVTLQGHTAETPDISHFHQEVTRKRVYYIQNYLVTKGIDLDRILLSFLDAPANITDLNKQQVHAILK